MELINTRVDEDARLVAEMRVTINQGGQTLEQVTGQMKSSHLQLLDLVRDEFRFNGAPEPVLSKLALLKRAAEEHDVEWYNTAANFKAATEQALRAQEDIFTELSAHQSWDPVIAEDLAKAQERVLVSPMH